ncbi:unnamed protein product [Rhizophagus irregularis]|nr:unnamed protein product [Rhizophagus irregularis]
MQIIPQLSEPRYLQRKIQIWNDLGIYTEINYFKRYPKISLSNNIALISGCTTPSSFGIDNMICQYIKHFTAVFSIFFLFAIGPECLVASALRLNL